LIFSAEEEKKIKLILKNKIKKQNEKMDYTIDP